MCLIMPRNRREKHQERVLYRGEGGIRLQRSRLTVRLFLRRISGSFTKLSVFEPKPRAARRALSMTKFLDIVAPGKIC